VFVEPVVREMLRALGIETCGRCFEVVRIHARGRVWVNEHGQDR
jgi:hypothetical protein